MSLLNELFSSTPSELLPRPKLVIFVGRGSNVRLQTARPLPESKLYRLSFRILNIRTMSSEETPYVPVKNNQFLQGLVVNRLNRNIQTYNGGVLVSFAKMYGLWKLELFLVLGIASKSLKTIGFSTGLV